MPGPLTNARHERFVQEVAKGKSWTDAFEQAGFVRSSKNAARLAGRADVKARLAELQARAAEKAVISAADIAAQLDEDRTFAIQLKAPAAAISATLGKAKVLGLIIEKQRHEFDLTGLSEEELEQLERILSRTAKP
jgi:phage terminase small subunit